MLKLTALALAGAAGAWLSSAVPRVQPTAQFVPDTLDPEVYEGWKQYSLLCSRCHGQDAQGSSFAPDLTQSFKPDGHVASKEVFLIFMTTPGPQGMPIATSTGLDSSYFDGVYRYLKGRSDGSIHPGRPVRRELREK
jgi:mono/diheme cytochrome c family protein